MAAAAAAAVAGGRFALASQVVERRLRSRLRIDFQRGQEAWATSITVSI